MKVNKKDKILNIEIDTSENINNLKNGDYKLIHMYDENELKKNIKLSKIDQLVTWINQTIYYTQDFPLNNECFSSVCNLYHHNKDDLIKLVNWLNKDNYD